jgi:hypothetical protein
MIDTDYDDVIEGLTRHRPAIMIPLAILIISLYRGARLCQEGQFQQWSFSLVDRGLSRGAGRHGVAAGAEQQSASQGDQQATLQQGQPAAMLSTDDVKGDYERIKVCGVEFTVPPTDVTA